MARPGDKRHCHADDSLSTSCRTHLRCYSSATSSNTTVHQGFVRKNRRMACQHVGLVSRLQRGLPSIQSCVEARSIADRKPPALIPLDVLSIRASQSTPTFAARPTTALSSRGHGLDEISESPVPNGFGYAIDIRRSVKNTTGRSRVKRPCYHRALSSAARGGFEPPTFGL